MKLIFKEKHLSIDNFINVELPDFTVLTGINGAGKSHLLESIQQKKLIINGFENASIAHFNYDSFRLVKENVCTAHQISLERESAWKFFCQETQGQIGMWKRQYLGQKYNDIIAICE